MTHPKVSSDPRLRERYGIKSAGKNRIWITLFSLFLVLSWFIWSGTNFANPDIRSTLISFKVVSDQKISITYKILVRDTTIEHSCSLVAKDIDKNTLTVGKKEDMKITNVNEVEIKYLNLLVDDLPENFEVAFRYQGKTENVIVKSKKENLLIIKTENEILKPASGQSAVFYKEGCCLGGGVIQ